jgi:hypothetical protein
MFAWLVSTLWAADLELYPIFLPSSDRNPDFLCNAFAEDLDICFVHIENSSVENTQPTFRIIKKDFLEGLTSIQAYSYAMNTVKDDIFDAFPKNYQNTELPEMKGSYLSGIGETGLGCAAVLYPQALELILRGTPMVAFPARDTCFIWRKENSQVESQFHLQMAIAIRLMYESTQYPVSKVIYQWNEEKWLPWGEAIKENEIQDSEPKKSPSQTPQRTPPAEEVQPNPE